MGDLVEEDVDLDIDTDDIKGQLKTMQDALQRHFGHHKDVARLKSEGRHKTEFVVITPNLARATPSETLLAMREELEQERKRRIEQMAGGMDDLDEETKATSENKKGVNEELLHLFAFHDTKYQAQSELTRQKVQDAKDIMHAELLRRSAKKTVEIEVEKERKRKLEELEKLARGEGENELEIAETSEQLSKVQNDLKNAFKLASKSQDKKKAMVVKISEERKEQVLQDIRRKSAVATAKKLSSKERLQRIAEFDERMCMMNDSSRDLLVNVQEQLLGLFSKLKKDKMVAEVRQVDKAKENKVRMQEELIRSASVKRADREASAEQARRIKEDQQEDSTFEMLLHVQRQLLDTCGKVQNEKLKHDLKLVQFLKTRQNVLKDIRNRSGLQKDERSKSEDLSEFKRARGEGRKISMIGDLAEMNLAGQSHSFAGHNELRNQENSGRKLSIIGEQFEQKTQGSV